jgi:hypothetical protein
MASGNTLAVFSPGSGYTDDGVASLVVDRLASYRLPANENSSVTFDAFMVRQYGLSGVTVVIAWRCTANTGSVKLTASFERLQNGTVLTASAFGPGISAVATASSILNRMQYTEINLSDVEADNIQPGEVYRLKIMRDATVDDNSTGDVLIDRVVVKEQ